MAIVQKVTNTVNGASSIAPALAGVTAGNTLVLVMANDGTSDVLPTDSAGQTWTKGFFLGNTSVCNVACYYLLSANAGTHTLSWATTGGASSFVNYALCEIPTCTAVDVVSTVGTAVNGATTLSTPSITTTNANDAIFAVISADTASGSTNAAITNPPAGWTSVYAQQNTSANDGGQISYKEVSSTGPQSATWTFNADTSGSLYAAAAISFKFGAASVAFAGGGSVASSGSGALTTKSVLAGAGVAKATGSGALNAGIALAGAGTASASGAGTLATRSVFAGSGVAAASGSGTLSGQAPVVTLKQYWLKNWQTGTTAASLQSGSNPMTVAAGSTLVAVWAGWDSTQIAAPVISAGSFTTPPNGAQFNGTNITMAIAYQANAAGGSVTTTAPNVAVGNSGEIGVWIYEVTNMPATAVVRNSAGTHVVSSSQSWSQVSDSSPQVGDLAFALTTYENSAGSVTAGLTDPPSGWTSRGVNQDATNFVPTEICSRIVSSAGVQTASWSNTDAATTGHLSAMLTLQTSAPTAVAFAGAGAGVASGSGTLTTKSVMAGAGAAASAGSGSLTVGAALSGAGAAAAVGSAALTTKAALAGAGFAPAAGSAGPTTQAVLSGAGVAGAAGSASLSTSSSGANLAGAGVASASGSAVLTVVAVFAGAGVARASGSGSLSQGAVLSGSGSAGAQGAATLTTAAALAGGGFSIATGAGVLTIGASGVSFVGNGTAAASGSAALTVRPRLAGGGLALATGSGTLLLASPFVTGNEAVWLVPARVVASHVSPRPAVVGVPARRTAAVATD